MGPGLRRFRRLRLWAGELARARRLRFAEARAALALLADSLSGAGLTLACPAPGGGMRADFGLDGSATLRFTAVEALAASDGVAALARLGGRMASARDQLASIRAALDALVGLFAVVATLAVALAAAARGSAGWIAILHAGLVPAAYAALIPCRRILMRLALRLLMRGALRRTGPDFDARERHPNSMRETP